SGLAIAGLILSFLAAPIGLILSLIAIFTTGRNGPTRGRGLAITGVIVSILVLASATALVVTAWHSTVGDSACLDGKVALSVSRTDDPDSLKVTVDALNKASAEAKHQNVRDALKAVADDYQKILTVQQTGKVPDDAGAASDKIASDLDTLNSVC